MSSSDKTISSPFIIGNIITDPNKFWGRKYEVKHIFNRLRKNESTSIIGPRRIGKSSLAYYIYKMGKKHGTNFDFVWSDSQSNHSASLIKFIDIICKNCSLKTIHPDDDLLCNFEDAIINHNKKIVIIINEFEILTDKDHEKEFGKDFFNTLRSLAEHGHCALITTSCLPLTELCKHVLGLSSPFYTVFDTIHLDIFLDNEANSFLSSNISKGFLSGDDVDFIKKNIKLYQHPLKLQITCDTLLKYRNKKLINPHRLISKIDERFKHFTLHTEIQKKRRVTMNRNNNNNNTSSKTLDLFVSILIPVSGIGLLMFEYAFLIEHLDYFKAILLALVTAILGFPILIFAGRYVDIIGESSFFKLFIKIIDQLPLLSNIADKIINVADKIQNKTQSE